MLALVIYSGDSAYDDHVDWTVVRGCESDQLVEARGDARQLARAGVVVRGEPPGDGVPTEDERHRMVSPSLPEASDTPQRTTSRLAYERALLEAQPGHATIAAE